MRVQLLHTVCYKDAVLIFTSSFVWPVSEYCTCTDAAMSVCLSVCVGSHICGYVPSTLPEDLRLHHSGQLH